MTHEQICNVPVDPATSRNFPSTTRSFRSLIADWPLPTVASRAELEQLLLDDVPYGDLTTEALGIGTAAGMMQFTARDRMVLALAEDAAAIIELAGCKVELRASFRHRTRAGFADPDGAGTGLGAAAQLEGGADADRDLVRRCD